MTRIARACLIVAALLVVSCTELRKRSDDDTPPPPRDGFLCTENLVLGVVLEVRDAVTGKPAAYGAVGEIRDGSYTETLSIQSVSSDPTQALWMSGAMERPGVYDVTVGKPGYLDWTGTAVVEADPCHVHTVTL